MKPGFISQHKFERHPSRTETLLLVKGERLRRQGKDIVPRCIHGVTVRKDHEEECKLGFFLFEKMIRALCMAISSLYTMLCMFRGTFGLHTWAQPVQKKVVALPWSIPK